MCRARGWHCCSPTQDAIGSVEGLFVMSRGKSTCDEARHGGSHGSLGLTPGRWSPPRCPLLAPAAQMQEPSCSHLRLLSQNLQHTTRLAALRQRNLNLGMKI